METLKLLFSFSISISIFLLSLRLMSDSVQAVLGVRLRRLLTLLTYNPLISLITGAVVTAAVQSSSAIAAITVALVNAGVLSLKQAFGVILGANIGTTITAQIAVLDMSRLIAPIMLCGLFLLPWNRKTQHLGTVLVGIGGLFMGLFMLKLSLIPLLEYNWVRQGLIEVSGHVLPAVLAGILITAVVQSSSAVTSVVIVLGQIQAISLVGAIAIAFGSNIGTVLTTLISSIGMSRESKAAAYADFLFNCLGVIIMLPVINQFARFVTLTSSSLAQQIANAHTLFNVITALCALILINPLTKIVSKMAGMS
ncbi:MAG: Na/Pi cotransporter family protein [Firmicutes bacterium]|jgi:phosphate:Na+ symporter|nr:Na/Pi cotransporter family protein [Bacillota bacterium]